MKPKPEKNKAKSKPKTTTDAAELHLPEPIELAKLASLLRPDAEPYHALKKAMELYVEAHFFLGELKALSVDELIRHFGSEDRRHKLVFGPFVQAIEEQWKDTLELSEAIDFVIASGLKGKTERALKNNMREYYRRLSTKPKGSMQLIPSFDDEWKLWTREEGGREVVRIPKPILEYVVRDAKDREKERKLKSWHTRKSGRKAAQKPVK